MRAHRHAALLALLPLAALALRGGRGLRVGSAREAAPVALTRQRVSPVEKLSNLWAAPGSWAPPELRHQAAATRAWPAWVAPAASCCAGAAVAAVLAYLWWLHTRAADAAGPEQRPLMWSRLLVDIVDLCMLARYSALIPASLDLARRLGHGATFSGLLLGTFWLPFFVGSLGYKVLAGRLSKKAHMLVGLGTTLLGTLAFTAFAVSPLAKAGVWPLVAAQVLSGAALAYTGVCRDVLRKELYPPKALVEAMVRKKVLTCLGGGLGPLLGPGLVAGLPGLPAEVAEVGGLIVLLPALSLLLVAFAAHFPSDLAPPAPKPSGHRRSGEPGEEEEAAASRGDLGARLAALLCIEGLMVCRAVLLSAQQVVTALILQLEFGWSHSQVGFAIAATSLVGALPSLLVYQVAQRTMSDWNWVRLTLWASVLGAVLLMGHWCMTGVVPCLALVLLADVVLFAALSLGDGVAQGWMLRYAMPSGWLTPTNLSFANMLLVSSLARALVPPLARWTYVGFGRAGYTGMLLTFSLCALALLEAGIAPFLRRAQLPVGAR